MKSKIKKLVIGLFLCASIAVTIVLASTGTVQKELWYNNIKITLDGTTITPTDANGNYVEPFIIDGTTYLPVRGIANALGMNVQWDGNTNTVELKSLGYSSSEADLQTISVYTAEELLENIGSNRKIILEAGSYNLSDVYNLENRYIDNQKYSEGYIIENVENLTIEGNAEILIDDIMADVLAFDYCSNINLIGITVGHSTPNEYYACEGAVISLSNCENIYIEDCNLYGCGAIGIYSYKSTNIVVNKTNIYDCTFSGISLTNNSSMTVKNSNIYDISIEDIGSVCAISNSNLVVSNSRIFSNHLWNSNMIFENNLIDVNDYSDKQSNVEFENTIFENNYFDNLTNIENPITKFENCKFINCYGNTKEENFKFIDCEFSISF